LLQGGEGGDGSSSTAGSSDGSQQQQYKFVLEPGTARGQWVPLAAGELPPAGTRVLSPAEAEALNRQ
jgi:hypothetical protein